MLRYSLVAANDLVDQSHQEGTPVAWVLGCSPVEPCLFAHLFESHRRSARRTFSWVLGCSLVGLFELHQTWARSTLALVLGRLVVRWRPDTVFVPFDPHR